MNMAVSQPAGDGRALQMLNDGLDFLPRGDVLPNLQLALLAFLGSPFDAAPAPGSKLANYVARDKAALLRVADQRREAGADFLTIAAERGSGLPVLTTVPSESLSQTPAPSGSFRCDSFVVPSDGLM